MLRVHRHDEEHDDEGEEKQIEVKPGESLLPKDDCESPSADRFIMHGVAPVVDDENTRRNGAAGTARRHRNKGNRAGLQVVSAVYGNQSEKDENRQFTPGRIRNRFRAAHVKVSGGDRQRPQHEDHPATDDYQREADRHHHDSGEENCPVNLLDGEPPLACRPGEPLSVAFLSLPLCVTDVIFHIGQRLNGNRDRNGQKAEQQPAVAGFRECH